jgi:hypothetical protein
MEYAVEMGSGDVIHLAVFIKTDSGTQKLMGGRIHRHTDRMVIS